MCLCFSWSMKLLFILFFFSLSFSMCSCSNKCQLSLGHSRNNTSGQFHKLVLLLKDAAPLQERSFQQRCSWRRGRHWCGPMLAEGSTELWTRKAFLLIWFFQQRQHCITSCKTKQINKKNPRNKQNVQTSTQKKSVKSSSVLNFHVLSETTCKNLCVLIFR